MSHIRKSRSATPHAKEHSKKIHTIFLLAVACAIIQYIVAEVVRRCDQPTSTLNTIDVLDVRRRPHECAKIV